MSDLERARELDAERLLESIDPRALMDFDDDAFTEETLVSVPPGRAAAAQPEPTTTSLARREGRPMSVRVDAHPRMWHAPAARLNAPTQAFAPARGSRPRARTAADIFDISDDTDSESEHDVPTPLAPQSAGPGACPPQGETAAGSTVVAPHDDSLDPGPARPDEPDALSGRAPGDAAAMLPHAPPGFAQHRIFLAPSEYLNAGAETQRAMADRARGEVQRIRGCEELRRFTYHGRPHMLWARKQLGERCPELIGGRGVLRASAAILRVPYDVAGLTDVEFEHLMKGGNWGDRAYRAQPDVFNYAGRPRQRARPTTDATRSKGKFVKKVTV